MEYVYDIYKAAQHKVNRVRRQENIFITIVYSY